MDKMMNMVCKEFDNLADKGALTTSNLDMAYKIVMMKEKLLRIEELEEKLGYSQAYPMYRGYGMPYVHDGNSYRGNRYSRDDGYSMMSGKLEQMLNDPALSQQEKNALRMALDTMK